ncbi:anillin isoform X2 [Scleropages formosus]|uniref:anillin isoform X2 n=1 Tax=Scleropages formosus TaxID=113540 RepID=UPI000877EAF3|nr:anillin isoform X2 [Scleropages formosus]
MDPFTEKLLERTRARRENLQRKMAERPTAANRLMAKRVREPLTVVNSVSEVALDNVLAPPPSSKPSPSKRRCSDEKELSKVGVENRDLPVAVSQEPAIEKKPPPGPVSVSSTSSLERNAVHLVVKTVESRDASQLPPPAVVEVKKDHPNATPQGSAGIRSRLQMLAEQRQYWDTDDPSDAVVNSVPISSVKIERQEVTLAPTSSETPLGRKGRLANLAATIGSWEDDLGHPSVRGDNAQEQPGTACPPPAAHGAGTSGVSTQPSSSSYRPQPGQQSICSSVKSTGVILPSPQKAEVPPCKSALPPSLQQTSSQAQKISNSPQKSISSVVPTALVSEKDLPSSPKKTSPALLAAGRPSSQSPLKSQLPAQGTHPSPKKQEPLTRSLAVRPAVAQSGDKTPLQSNASCGATAGGSVKSFLERFGERCQERSVPNTPTGQRTPAPGQLVNPRTRLAQERLQSAAQSATSCASLSQKQKLEREIELAQIRNRFQKGNMWKRSPQADTKPTAHPAVSGVAEPHTEKPIVPPVETLITAEKASTTESLSSVDAPVPSTNSLQGAELSSEKTSEDQEEQAGLQETEMNIDDVNSSEVINKLFHGVLEDSGQPGVEDDDDDDDQGESDEDALNISSMSLLTPLAETVAAVVRSPELKLTSTPSSSFMEKTRTPDSASQPSKFHRARMRRSRSSDNFDLAEEDQHLPYSIDAYRSTRIKEKERPHVKQVIVRKEEVKQRAEEVWHNNCVNIKQKIKVLTNEMNLQQTVIHQASQALNCCTDEEHGKGSQVEAEAEKLLLIATEKRVALKAELDRLKAEGLSDQRNGPNSSSVRDEGNVSATKGSITLLELRLPLKAEFVCSAANKPETANYFFFILIRAGAENIMATSLASTRSTLSGDAISFSSTFTIPDVSSDFEINLEAYCLVQKRDLYPDKKKKPSKSKAITPKRLLTSIAKSNVHTPVMASPGGPNAVRTSNFALVGSHKLTLASIGKNKFPLEKVPFLCPLEGHVCLKLQCEVDSQVEERGFLTMFEDVSGFGAWHRRWCVLSGYCISYWTYPDDEKRKNPIGRINLASCTNRKVEPANREFCARPNTFELITIRPQREDDKETLVSRCKNTMCVTKNWLSADTKDERNLWMQKLNQVLLDLRMWQPDSCYRPI